jgi:hypothetical protein
VISNKALYPVMPLVDLIDLEYRRIRLTLVMFGGSVRSAQGSLLERIFADGHVASTEVSPEDLKVLLPQPCCNSKKRKVRIDEPSGSLGLISSIPAKRHMEETSIRASYIIEMLLK